MNMPTFNDLLNDILNDYRNQFPEADTSQGSLIFIKSACLASALWGIYHYADFVGRQIFPDTANSVNLRRHAYIYDIQPLTDETDAALLARLLDRIRNPPAGGNANDYEEWALAVDGVAAAYVFPLAQGGESVDVVIVGVDPAIPGQDLLDDVTAYIAERRPVGARFVRILAPTILEQDVTMTVTLSGTITLDDINAEITACLNAMTPGQALYVAQLISAAIAAGAIDAVVTLPAATVTPDPDEIIRAGTISVTEA